MARSVKGLLSELGLEQYLSLFEDFEIDLEILRELNSQDLEELGLPLEARKRIAESATGIANTSTRNNTEAGETKSEPERRQVTIMFCDLVGSTTLSGVLDPEDLRDVMRAYTDRCADAICAYDGFIAQTRGDGLLVYFGYPIAHEDGAERSLYAALGCLEAIRSEPLILSDGRRLDLRVRIGVHTGLVIAGQIGGADTQADNAIVGEAPNIAARLQSIATPNSIVVSEETRRLAGGRFQFLSLGAQVLKGVVAPVHAHQLLREDARQTRFESRAGQALTPLVARHDEIDTLKDCWVRARNGVFQTVLISGLAGIGKSRITESLVESIDVSNTTMLRFQCSPHRNASSLFPVVQHMNNVFDRLQADTPRQKLRSLVKIIRVRGKQRDKSIALIASLLSIRQAVNLPNLDMSPQQVKEETIQALIDQVSALAQAKPLLLVIEDIHWADATTIEVLKALCGPRNMRALLIATHRTGLGPTWRSAPNITRLELGRLTRLQALEMVRSIAEPVRFTSMVEDALVDRSDGVPLYVEELTKTVIDSVAQDRDTKAPSATLPTKAVPVSLVDALVARLDSLVSSKQTAQFAACIGREFSIDLLRRISIDRSASLSTDLERIVASGIVQFAGRGAGDRFVFKHALVQDAAYRSLLKVKRRKVHFRIVTALEKHYPQLVRDQPEIVAHHCEAAVLPKRAVKYLIRAGRAAIDRSANDEAVSHLRAGLQLLRQNPTLVGAPLLELEIQSIIGIPLIGIEGYASKLTASAFERAKELSEELGNVQSRFQALYGLWGYRWMAGAVDESRHVADEMLSVANQRPTDERSIIANRCMASTAWVAGDFELAQHHFDIVLRLTGSTDTAKLAIRYAACPRVAALVLGGHSLWFMGDPEGARALVRRGLTSAYSLDHPYSIALAESILAGLLWLEEDYDRSQAHAELVEAISRKRRFAYWLGYAEMIQGSIMSKAGNIEAGVSLMKQAIAKHSKMGVGILRTMQLSMLADAAIESRMYQTAFRLTDQALDIAHQTGERQWLSILNRQADRLEKMHRGLRA